MLTEKIIGDGEIITRDKVKIAMDRLKAFEPADGYYLAFSGGKDSVVIKALADMAGVKYDAHYNLTTVDPPELVRFIKDVHPDVEINYPKESMWKMIVTHGIPPTRRIRYCCKELKESSGKGRITITGIRWAESTNRKNNRHLVDIGNLKTGEVLNDDNHESRRIVEQCYRTRKTLVNPIIDWTDDDVWQFIKENNTAYCCLYDEGFKRLGCIGCPMAGNNRAIEFERWPTYKRAYIRAFGKLIESRKQKGLPADRQFESAENMFAWWMEEITFPRTNEDQIEMEEYI
jgi:phosphoadenosine phosphosulfate reductase